RSDPGGTIEYLHDTMLVRDESGDQDTGFWNFKLGLALRAFNAIYQMQELGALSLDQNTLDHLELLTLFARHAIKHSMRSKNGQTEALTSAKASETNSETQPWVALGFVPAVEWTIFGKPASASKRGSSVRAPQRQNGEFNAASPPIEVEWQCNPTDVQRLF